MNLFVNGDSRQVEACSVTDLVNELGLAPETVLVELNGLALHRSEWPQPILAEGDRIEILRVAAGG